MGIVKIFGGISCSNFEITQRLHHEIMEILPDAEVECLNHSREIDEIIDQAYLNPNSKLLFGAGKIPQKIFDFFNKNHRGLQVLQQTNVNIGYIKPNAMHVTDIVLCFNHTGKIDVHLKKRIKKNRVA